MTTLILTDEGDTTAARVAAELAGRGHPVVRFDPADFPTELSLSATIGSARPWTGALSALSSTLSLNLSDVSAVYYRRPNQFRLPAQMSGPERLFAYGEARRGFGGVLQALADCLWINDPVAAARCEYKPVQLAAASACGLTVPETLISNDPKQAHEWATSLGEPLVYKPLSGSWHADENQLRVLYTSPVTDPAQLLEQTLAHTAHLFQALIDKEFDSRAIVVGEQVFTVAIHAGSDQARDDWRSDYDALTYEVIELPSVVRAQLVDLHRRLGLVYGAVDLVHDTTGQVVFLETNQAGEWGWIADETGLPIAQTVADLLQDAAP